MLRYLKGENCDEKEVWVFDYVIRHCNDRIDWWVVVDLAVC